MKHYTLDTIQSANEAAGLYFFSPGARKFFSSRILSTVHQGIGGVYFVTSERESVRKSRRYSVRQFHPATGRITLAGEFQGYETASIAQAAAARFASPPTHSTSEN